MKRAPLSIAVLFTVCCGGALLVVSGDDPPASPGRSTPASAVDDGATIATAAAAVERNRVPSDCPPLPTVVEPPAARPLVVQVWRGQVGVAAADAEVFVLESAPEIERRAPFATHCSELAVAGGTRFEVDRAGMVELPAVQQFAVVTARIPGWYGFACVTPDHAEVEDITLQPDETVTIRLVDAKGTAVAGMPVGIAQHVPVHVQGARAVEQDRAAIAAARRWASANPSRPEHGAANLSAVLTRIADESARRPVEIGDQVELLVRRCTDERGLAVFRHFQLHRHRAEAWWPFGYADRFEARVISPTPGLKAMPFDGPCVDTLVELHAPLP